jgi:hypothetical protein
VYRPAPVRRPGCLRPVGRVRRAVGRVADRWVAGPIDHAADPTRRPSLYFAAVNAEFNWWLLIVGLVVGAGLVWYVLMDARRRESDVADDERPREAAWLSATLADEGWDVPPDAATRLLELHRAYLEAPPPDAVPEPMVMPEGAVVPATPGGIAGAAEGGPVRAGYVSQPDVSAPDTDPR